MFASHDGGSSSKSSAPNTATKPNRTPAARAETPGALGRLLTMLREQAQPAVATPRQEATTRTALDVPAPAPPTVNPQTDLASEARKAPEPVIQPGDFRTERQMIMPGYYIDVPVLNENYATRKREATRAQERRTQNASPGNKSGDKVRTVPKEITAERYNAMTDLQRAGVDANTILIDAVRRDKQLQDTYDPTEEQRERYEQNVLKRFTDDSLDGGYFPETLNALDQLGYKAPEGTELQDFVKFRTLITGKDIKNLKKLDLGVDLPWAGTTGREYKTSWNEDQKVRWDQTVDLAQNADDLRDKLVKDGPLLDTLVNTARAARSGALNPYGGLYEERYALGYNPKPNFDAETGQPTDLDSFFQWSYGQLSKRSGEGRTMDQILDYAKQAEMTPEEVNMLYRYLDERTQNEKQYGVETDGATRGPRELRKLLNLNRSKKEEGRGN